MNYINKKILKTTTFAVAALAAVMLVTSAIGTSMVVPAFAQGDNMTAGGNVTGGNVTGGNMTSTDMGGSGMATPPAMTP